MEVEAQTRKLLLQQKVKLGWLICKIEDYLFSNRCFSCSRFNHRFRECRGEETYPMCMKPQAERMYSISNGIQIHQLPDVQQNRTGIKKSVTATLQWMPQLKAILEKYVQNTDY